MPCTYCHKSGHNRKTCSEYLTTISSGLCCPNCEACFTDTPFAMLNCGHPMCLTCVMNMGSASGSYCTDCSKEETISGKILGLNENIEYNEDNESNSVPPSPSKSSDLVAVNNHGVFFCKRTNTYVYNRVRFNTLRAAINCRKAYTLLGNETTSMGKGVYLYNNNSYNSLEMLRRAQSCDITNFMYNKTIEYAIDNVA